MEQPPPSSRPTRRRKNGVDESSDFEPTAEEEKGEEDVSDSDHSKNRSGGSSDESGSGRRSARLRGRTRNSQRSRRNSDSGHDSELDPEELAEEAQELTSRKRARTSRRHPPDDHLIYDGAPKLRDRNNKPPPDYRIFRPEALQQLDDEEVAPIIPITRTKGGRTAYRSLFSTQGPFGGGGESVPFGPEGAGAAGGADSDSSDDDMPQRVPRGMGGAVGMTPTATAPHML